MVRRRAVGGHGAFGGCACCVVPIVPTGRPAAQSLNVRRVPLSHDARLAFLMGSSNTSSASRLAADCVEPLRDLPSEVVIRIFEFCATVERVQAPPPAMRSAPPPPPSSRHAGSAFSRDPREPFGGDVGMGELSLCDPCI